MNGRAMLFPTVVSLLSTAASAQQFEGIVTIKTLRLSSEVVTEQAGDDPARALDKLSAMTIAQLVRLGADADSQLMQVKGPRWRGSSGDMGAMGQGYMLMDVAKGTMQIVMPAQRSYTEASLRELGRDVAGQDDEEEEPKVEPLGRTQTINGLRCTGYRVTDDESVSIVWTTTDPGFRDVFQTQLRLATDDDPGVARVKSLLQRYGYPVMTQEVEGDGQYRVETWALERRPMADSLFVIPTGYRKMTMPGMR